MIRCTGTHDWRGGVRGLATTRATPRSHALLHGRRVDPTPRETNPRPTDEGTAGE